MSTNPLMSSPDAKAYYADLFHILRDAYWQASGIDRKDQVAAARDEAYDILTTLNKNDLATNTAGFIALSGKVKLTNIALEKIKTDIDQITRNISTAAAVVSAITKVLSIATLFA